MRIDLKLQSINNYKMPITRKPSINASTLINQGHNYSLQFPNYINYSKISFKGNNKTELELLKSSNAIVDNTTHNIELQIKKDFLAETTQGNEYSKFSEGLTLLQKNNPDLFGALIQGNKKEFKKIEQEYNIFYGQTLQSLDDVNKGEKTYSPFWANEMRVGAKPLIDIWNKVLPTKNADLNNTLQKASEKDIRKLKEVTVMAWFKNALQQKDKEDSIQNNQTNDYSPQNLSYGLNEVKDRYEKNPLFMELIQLQKESSPESELPGSEVEKVLRGLSNKEIELNNQFNEMTYNQFYSPNSSREDKLKAFGVAFAFIAEKLSNDSPEEVDRTLKVVNDFKKSTQEAEERGNPVYAYIGAKKIFNLARDYWFKEHFPQLMDEELKKRIFVEKALKSDKSLKYLKTYSNLSVDDKYFIGKYYESQRFIKHKDDPMKKMLNDRNILDKSQVIDEITQKVKTDTEVLYSQLDNIGSILKSEEAAEQLEGFKITGRNKDESTDLLTIYLQTMGQRELAVDSNANKKVEFLSGLTEEELLLANEKIKEDWKHHYLPAKIDKEVEFQAYKTSTDVQMLDELKKINENLGDIKIKLEDVTLSLGDIVTNLDGLYGKFRNPVDKTIAMQQNSNLYLESMKSSIDTLDPESSQKVLTSFKTDGVKYLDILSKNTNDETSKKMLSNIKNTVINANNPNAVISRLESYGTLTVMNALMHKGMGSNPISLHNNFNALTQSSSIYPLTEHIDAPTFSDQAINYSLLGVTSGSLGATSSSLGATTAATGAKAAGLKAGLLNPYTAAIAAAMVGFYGIYKASTVHKQFSDVYFGK